VPGIRATKRRLGHDKAEDHVRLIAPPSSITAPSSIDASLLAEEDDDALAQWTQDATMDVPDNNADFLQNLDSTITSIPSLEFDMDSLLQPFPTSSATPSGESRRTQTSAAQELDYVPHPPRDRSDSQFVVDCTQIVSDLENYIVADLKSFKVVLGLVKRALEQVFRLSNNPQAARNMRCTILLIVVMYQIVELLNVCYTMLSEDSDPQCQPSFSLRPATSLLLPGMGIGDFGIDAEEQYAWRSQKILREVRQAGELLHTIKMLASKGSEQMHPSHGRSRGECFVDLELQLTDLAGRIARRR
jgi:hypothetical protein